MDMFFPDGRPFHRMGFGPDSSHAQHWCDPDTYRVSYTLDRPRRIPLLLGCHAARPRTSCSNPCCAAFQARQRVNALIVVSAVCVFDDAGRLLTVRKRGTDKFMHPGGKPEAGETAAQTASRELEEEVGIVLAPEELELLGIWLADAANEAATQIEATVFTAPGIWSAQPLRPRSPRSGGWTSPPSCRTIWPRCSPTTCCRHLPPRRPRTPAGPSARGRLLRPPPSPRRTASGTAPRSGRLRRAARCGFPAPRWTPPSTTKIASAARIVESRWAITTAVRPSSAAPSASCTAASLVESSAAVASSRITTRGWAISRRAMVRRCRSPPESR